MKLLSIHPEEIKILKGIAESTFVEICGSLRVDKNGVLTTDPIMNKGGARTATCGFSQFGFHTHPIQAYRHAKYGWPGKTDLLTFSISAIDGKPMMLHFVVAYEGIYTLVFHPTFSCSSCERKAQLMETATLIHELFDRGFKTPQDYCKSITNSSLPMKVIFISYNTTAPISLCV